MHFSTPTFVAAVLGASSVSAHVEMIFPPPFKSKHNSFAGQDIDYSMTAPLSADGSDYPCKGYQSVLGTSAGSSVASFAQGAAGNVTVAGGAIHGGGSCQISVSTDSAKTFTVIQSFIGGCPASLTSTLDFTMPSDVPAGDAILAWSWNNQIGNREFYMNCAAITVTGASSKAKKDTTKRSTAFSARPAIFVANLGTTTCAVAENIDVIYPDAGPDVVTDAAAVTGDPTGSCGAVVDSSGSGSSTGSSSSAVVSSAAAATSTSAAAVVPGGVFITSATAAASSAAAKPTTLATVTSSAVVASSAAASSSTSSASVPAASSGSTTTVGALAVGAACTDEGEWNCINSSSFQRCASGAWSAVQQMAAGMECTTGESETLVMAASKSSRVKRRAAMLVDARRHNHRHSGNAL